MKRYDPNDMEWTGMEQDAEGKYVLHADAQAALAAKDAELAKLQKSVRGAEEGNRSLRRDMDSAVSWWAGRFREWMDMAQRQRDAGKPYSPTEARAAIEELLGDKGREYFDIQWKFKRDCEAAEKGNRRLKKELAAKDAAHELEIQRWMGVYATQTAAILEWEAKVKAKDAALAECVEAMEFAEKAFQETLDDSEFVGMKEYRMGNHGYIAFKAILTKHRPSPKEGADNVR